MRFQRKPTFVEAEQFLHPATAPMGVYVGEKGAAWVMTIHLQKVFLQPGDWILPESDGEHYYPVKDSEMKRLYDPCPVA